MRYCSKCKQAGHNARTCTTPVNANPEIIVKTSKMVELGHKIIEAENKVEERVEIGGILPAKGLWILNLKTKRVAGRISKVKQNGDIIYRSSLGAIMTTPQNKFIDEGYVYFEPEDLEPEMMKWEVL